MEVFVSFFRVGVFVELSEGAGNRNNVKNSPLLKEENLSITELWEIEVF